MIFDRMPDREGTNLFNKGRLSAMALIALLPTIELPSAEAARTKDPIMTTDVLAAGPISGHHIPIEVPVKSTEERPHLLDALQDILAKISIQQRTCADMHQKSGAEASVQLASLDNYDFDDLRTQYMRVLSLLSNPADQETTNDELRTMLAKLNHFSSLIALDIEKCRASAE